MKFVQNAAGAILGPMDSWLVLLRGTKTLPIRMERTNQNALALAEHLGAHRASSRCSTPACRTIPTTRWRRVGRGFGGLISFDVGSIEAAREILPRFRLMSLAGLGGVDADLAPAVMTHASVPAGAGAAIGITDGLIRISVGIEDIDDLEDVDQALGLSAAVGASAIAGG